MSASIQSRKDYKDTPVGQYKYWCEELKASEKNLRHFRDMGGRIVTRYKGGSKGSRDARAPDERGGTFNLNLFHANTKTLESMLYGRTPSVDVSRRHADPNDDVGRVAANIIDRVLNNDIQDCPAKYNSVLKASLQDRLLPGLGCAKVRYEAQTEMQMQTMEVNGVLVQHEVEVTTYEDAPIEYYHWRDVSWGWARTFEEVPWIGFRTYLTKDEVEAKWGEQAANGVELKDQSVTSEKEEASLADEDGPWKKAEIWEIWDKTKRQVVWVSKGYDRVLETKDDFLKLENFYPCPPFMLANQTTSLYVPVSDFYIAQDLYNEIDILQTRISIITEAVKIVGVYDQSAGDSIGRMFKEGTDNDLIPVDNWALFAEKGGIKGTIDWFPLGEVVGALSELIKLRDQNIELLQQVTGMADIMRGQLSGQYEGVGQSKIRAKYGSLRVQSLQEEFSRFATDLMCIKAEIISKHFEPETIARLALVDTMMQADIDLIQPAIQLIKDFNKSKLKVVIKSESMAMIDYQEQQAERTQYLNAVSNFLKTATPMIESMPSSATFLLQMMQWGLAGFKGADEIEGVVDKAIQMAEEEKKKAEQKPPQPDPQEKLVQSQMQLAQMKHQFSMEEIQAKNQGDVQLRQLDMSADIEKIRADLQSEITQIITKMKAEIQTELVTKQATAVQDVQTIRNEIAKDSAETSNEIARETVKAELEIKKIGEQHALRPDNEK
jgi:hypothetical protein